MSKGQKEATVQAILSTLEARDTTYEMSGSTPVSEVLTDADKTTVRSILFTQFREKEISYKVGFQAKVDDDKELKKYVSGLLNNWIRKAKEFNCGEVYKAKNPGSRAHSSDATMKALKTLLSQVIPSGDEKAIAEIKTAIENRKAEIKPATAVKPINVDALPDHLKSLVTPSFTTTTSTSEEVVETI